MPHFVEVILPLAIPNAFTYHLPDEWKSKAAVGKRVEVQFGKSKHYSGIIKSIFESEEDVSLYKPVINILDLHPILTEEQFKLWTWVAKYYCVGIGQVMNIALPPGLKMNSESIVSLHPDFHIEDNEETYPDDVTEVIETLRNQGDINLDTVRKVLSKKNVTATLNFMLEEEMIVLKEELIHEYKVKKEVFVRLKIDTNDQKAVHEALDATKKSEKQTNVILALLQAARENEWSKRKEISKITGVDASAFNALEKKNLIDQEEMETNRLKNLKTEDDFFQKLTLSQQELIQQIDAAGPEKPNLIHGVTGSGKTRIFTELIEKTIQEGGQVLYLAPEITLATQLVERIKKQFGSQLHPYHSRLSSLQKVDVWKAVHQGFPIILGAKSAVFLPFTNLQLIIVDEEHDDSYKNSFNAPRYHARDVAIVLSKITGARIVLGSATPSLESYYNAKSGKYNYFRMDQRIDDVKMPQMELIDIKRSERIRRHKFQLAEPSLEKIQEALHSKKQILIYINRRGFAPVFECEACAWTPKCGNCDVTLTYHKFSNQLHCHLCGHKEYLPTKCPTCSNHTFDIHGAGTQRIEDELNIFFPEAVVERLDMDNARSSKNLLEILDKIENREIDIIVGTRMATKGLDFDNLALAIVVNADSLFSFPDFRSHENALQQLIQIGGRVGRKFDESAYFIQTAKPNFEMFQFLDPQSHKIFLEEELKTRKDLNYPPFSRLIKITLKHKNAQLVENSAEFFADGLRKHLDSEILGPSSPLIGRVRNYYLKDILIKLPTDAILIARTKEILMKLVHNMEAQREIKGLKLVLDIDP